MDLTSSPPPGEVIAARRWERRAMAPALRLSPAWVVTMVVVLASFFGPIRPRPDPDTWWHIATGRWILAHGRIPTADPFSWTAYGRPWVAHEWGTDMLFAALNRWLGPASLLIVAGILIGSAFLVLASALRIVSDNEWVVAGCLCAAFYPTMLMWSLRPHLISILFVALYLRALIAARFKGRVRDLWWLVPATAIWSNLHAGFISGVVLIWIFAVVTVIERRPHARTFAGVAIGATVAGALNPAGFGIYPFALYLAKVSSNVQEWQPPNLRTPYGLVFAVFAIGTLVLAGMAVRRVDRALLTLAGVFILLGFGAVRNVPVTAFMVVPCLACVLVSWGKIPQPRPETGAGRVLLGAVAVAVLFAGLALAASNLAGKSSSQLLSERFFPVAAANFLSHQPAGRMVNPYDWGGYLIWKTPRLRVSIDGRADMYGVKLLHDDQVLEKLQPGWRQYLQSRHVRYVLWKRSLPLTQALLLDPQWRPVFQDHTSIVFERA
ncbi:MAG: hypothetical protein M3P18_18680 [Actinomycetota bacterium]|nr:hypothetical protein [Actinomycetota bacterium]